MEDGSSSDEEGNAEQARFEFGELQSRALTTKSFVDTTKLFVDSAFMEDSLPRPTESELSILQVLWDRGSCRVREVVEALTERRGEEVGYTTALKLLQIMHGKGLVDRDESERSHRYTAALPQASTQRQVLAGVTDKLFGGATSELVMHALASQPSSVEERAKIRQLLDQLERDEMDGKANHKPERKQR